MQQAPGEAVQRVCPRCGALAYTTDRRCPWCGGAYRRRLWPVVLVVALVQSALVLGGVALMLQVFGDELNRRLDDQVSSVQRDLDTSFDQVRTDVRRELDRRLPAP
jgi:RNA polymerase subunit RPABC4/transcription elongation factor Spt4